MKKLLAVILSTVCLCGFSPAQTVINGNDTNTIPIQKATSQIIGFLAQATNLMVATYGIAATDGKAFGGGVALAYRMSDMIVPTVRVDYYDREIWMPSANLQLQAPLVLGGAVTVIPFAFAGVASALGGHGFGIHNGDVVGLFGAGAAVRLSKKWDIVADYEKWSGFNKDQVRFGVLYKF